MKHIRLKNGSVLSVVVTIFVMIALLSATLIILLQQEIIYLNPKYVSSSDNNIDNSNNEENNNSQEQKNDLSKYEGIINGIQLKELLQEIGKREITNIVIYINENSIKEEEATKDKANTIIMANARITNSTEYTKIIEESSYKVIYEKNSVNVVEKIYVIKISKNI